VGVTSPRGKAALRRLLGPRYHRLFPDWHRDEVGGLWDEVGRLQQRFLVEQGLRPEHRFLDVGCGSLRAGVHLIDYLDPGRYHGIDASAQLLAAGRVEIERNGLQGKAPVLRCDATFGVDAFGGQFDYGIAHSVFTHLPINSILVCLQRVRPMLRPEGRFYATFFENPGGTRRLDVLEHPRTDGPPLTTYPDADPFHYGLDLFEWLCDGSGLSVEYLGDWGNPRSQKMLVFTPD
jgi:SAM-dependent methyltransferase